MKKLLLLFSKPIVGGILSLIGVLGLLLRIPSSYFIYPVPLGVIILLTGIVIMLLYLRKQLRIWYYIRTYTSDSFGGSYQYKWSWVKT